MPGFACRAAILTSLTALVPGLAGSGELQAQAWQLPAPPSNSVMVAVNDTQVISVPQGAAKVFVANPEIADAEALDPQRLVIFGRKRGSSTIVVVTRYGMEYKYNVMVGRPLEELRANLVSLFPGENLMVRDAPNGLTLTGTISNSGEAEKARKVVGQYLGPGETLNFNVRVTAGSQVNLHVRVIEVSRDASQVLGFNLGTLINSGSAQIGILTGRVPFANGSVTGSVGGDGVFNRSAQGNSSLGLKLGSGGDALGGVIDALKAKNLLKVLAEPNLTAATGETANFLAGGQIPVPVARGTADIAQVTVEWKDFGIGLKFTPTIVDANDISIKVSAEVSELSDIGATKMGNYTIPAISTRRVDTTVNLADGQSFAIAGLFNERSTRSLSEFPVLGSIPILGELFRSRSFRNSKTELIVIVTPYLSAPADRIENIALPDEAPQPGDSPLLAPPGKPEAAGSAPSPAPPAGNAGGELAPIGDEPQEPVS